MKLSKTQLNIVEQLQAGATLSRNISSARGRSYETWIHKDFIDNRYEPKRVSPCTIWALKREGVIKEINKTWQGSDYVLVR